MHENHSRHTVGCTRGGALAVTISTTKNAQCAAILSLRHIVKSTGHCIITHTTPQLQLLCYIRTYIHTYRHCPTVDLYWVALIPPHMSRTYVCDPTHRAEVQCMSKSHWPIRLLWIRTHVTSPSLIGDLTCTLLPGQCNALLVSSHCATARSSHTFWLWLHVTQATHY